MKLIQYFTNTGNSRLRMFACAAALFLGAIPLQASLVISAGSVTALAGSTGNAIDISITNTGPSSTVISGFSLDVLVSGTAVTFNSLSNATAVPYIFAGHSAFGPNIATSITGQMANASDLFSIPLNGATIGSGVTLGLADLMFSVASQTPPGTFVVSINPFPDTSLSDPQGNNIPLQSLAAGQITIPGQVSVPEPSAFLEIGLALLLGAVISLRPR